MSLLRDSLSGFEAASRGHTLQLIFCCQSFIGNIYLNTILEYAREGLHRMSF